MPKQKYNVAGLGEVLWDVFPNTQKLGGAPANFTAHAQQLGAKSFIISCVGEDPPGEKILGLLKQFQVDTSGLQFNKHFATGSAWIRIDQNGNPTYTIQENTAWDHINFETIQKKIAQCLDAICFGTLAQRSPISQKSIFKIIEATSPNCLRVFDVNFRKDFYRPEMLRQSLNLANAVKMNQQEFIEIGAMFSLPKNPKKGLRALMNQFDLKIAILTLGEKGALMASKDDYSIQAPNRHINIKSTVGAGDAFTAGAVMGWLNQKPLDQINKEASDLAAYVCSHLEAVPSLKD